MLQYPIDFMTKINNYKSQFPLEYEKTVTDWCLRFRCDTKVDRSGFQIWCDKTGKCIFEYHFDKEGTWPHSLELLDKEYLQYCRSQDGIHFTPFKTMFMYSQLWMRPFFNEDVMKLIGIKYISMRPKDGNIDLSLLKNLPRLKPNE